MNTTEQEKKSIQHKSKQVIRLFLIISILFILLLTARWTIQSVSSHTLPDENLSLVPLLTPSATVNTPSAVPVQATRTSMPVATNTPTTIATSTSTPTSAATFTAEPSPTPPIKVKFIGESTKLRTGPGTSFKFIRTLHSNEMLTLLGRTNDNSWLYIKTSDRQEGWIKPTWVDLSGLDLESFAIIEPTVFTSVKVLGDPVYLRTGPGLHYVKVTQLSYGDTLAVLGRLNDNTWLFVSNPDGQEGWISTGVIDPNGLNFYGDFHPVKTPPPTETSTPVILTDVEGPWIDIDLSEQRLRAYNGTEMVGSFLVSTGIDIYPTVTGRFRIYAKFRYSDMTGSDYYLPDVPYAMYYDGDFSIHGTYWHHNFGTPMSHGCVNMDISDAGFIYEFAPIGTLVNIHW